MSFLFEKVDRELNEEELRTLNEYNNGYANTIGMVITACGPECVTAHIDVGPQHLQPAGIVNGGVYAGLAETVGSVAAMATAGRPAVGMNNNTDLLRSVRDGRIEASARPVHVGRRTHLWRIEMHHEGKLVALTNLKLLVP